MTTIRRSTLATLLAATLLLPSLPAIAHTDDVLDAQKAPNGGQMRMAGAYHFELVVKPGQLTVYVTDHGGKKIPTQGASGTATVLAGKGRTSIKLSPAGDNLLKGSGQFSATPDMKVVVSITQPGKTAEQARFTPLQKTAAAGAVDHSKH